MGMYRNIQVCVYVCGLIQTHFHANIIVQSVAYIYVEYILHIHAYLDNYVFIKYVQLIQDS